MTKFTVGDYLLLRLKQIGIKHIFGVPGDYNMEFLDSIFNIEGIEWIGTCNELNAAYAADGYARINGIAALVTTFGVGELSAINGIAGAYAEYVPVVAITGSPATKKQKMGGLLHHTLGTGDFTMFARMYEKVTVAQAYLTAENATAEIDRVLGACLLKKQPVYISLPMDVASTEVAAPSGELVSPVFESDRLTLEEAIDASVTMLEKAEKPIILADVGVDRYRLHNQLRDLLAATGYPYATLSMGKALLEETHPQYIGIYNGAISDNYVRRRIEEADCVLSIGTYLTDFNTGKFSAQLDPSRTIEVHGQYLKIKRALYNNVAMRDFLPALSKKLQHRDRISLDIKPVKDNLNPGFTTSFQPNDNAPIKQERWWQRMAHFLKEDDIVVAEIGVSFFGALLVPFPKGTTFVGQLLWASIGYSLGAVLGCALAAPQRRCILIIGDGSFQMTAQELSTILRYNLKPIIFLMNNDGYTIERDIHGEKMPYNDIQRWDYYKLPEVFANNSWSMKVSTESELETAVSKAEKDRDSLAFIEIVMDKMDNPEILLKLLQQ
ncbi:alpha-keto acid decarboxylase family protein [Phormidium sp. LEGE 05292]|uniref:alpha-keto acid decarboxylase family protein n=1 Tax=[Phormidium] sp. LEGE 05292 TaxID=767427 RepID=UPI0018814ABB|nr:alpha-keto acid decarboxylase family protein [Phormidium sp. LEGE 05292]MBE9225565.1 alpha-keto acid decarboxylase family protein [Phormidium sp. LEGE 05292]